MSEAFADVTDDNESNNGDLIINDAVEQKVRSMSVGSDPDLNPDEKETSLVFPNDKDCGNFYSEVPTMIKWFLSIEGSVIEDFKEVEDVGLVSIKGKVPKSYFKFQKSARKSTAHSQMVSYGEERE